MELVTRNLAVLDHSHCAFICSDDHSVKPIVVPFRRYQNSGKWTHVSDALYRIFVAKLYRHITQCFKAIVADLCSDPGSDGIES